MEEHKDDHLNESVRKCAKKYLEQLNNVFNKFSLSRPKYGDHFNEWYQKMDLILNSLNNMEDEFRKIVQSKGRRN